MHQAEWAKWCTKVPSTKVMVCGSITKDGMSKSDIGPCGVCCLRVIVYSVVYLQCGKWIHCGCYGVKWMAPRFLINFTCQKCEWNIGNAAEQEVKLCDVVETVSELTYLGDRVSVGGGCEAPVMART